MTFEALGISADQAVSSPFFWLILLLAIVGMVIQESYLSGRKK